MSPVVEALYGYTCTYVRLNRSAFSFYSVYYSHLSTSFLLFLVVYIGSNLSFKYICLEGLSGI